MRVLITNDDGIDSPGLAALASVARGREHETLVAAPCWDSSGASASVTGVTEGRGLLVESRSWPGWPPGSVLAVNATPALICRSAFQGAYGSPPDLVLSGINRGLNTGHAILHSGTVGAALTAYQQERPALAVSLDVVEAGDAQWATAEAVAGVVLDWLSGAGRAVAINCNVPNVPIGLLRGIRAARLAPVGTAQTSLSEQTGETWPLSVGDGEHEGPRGDDPTRHPVTSKPRTTGGALEFDTELLAQAFASVTAVVPIVEDHSVDLTALAGLVAPN
ncbi:MAG: 5'/3'-nucleotidase SurE [Acidimicrobiaceae bacterium]|nr:5'/3'-nucleotidase SurE [Acidimicrobiaceae bacterium]MBO0746745.1 5'/3'-nucleotidase SurE [Acidimicrobiaceae bacterium]